MMTMVQFLTVLADAGRFSETDEAITASYEGHLWVARFDGQTYVREGADAAAVASELGCDASDVSPLLLETEEQSAIGPVGEDVMHRVFRAHELASRHGHAWGTEGVSRLLGRWSNRGAPEDWMEQIARLIAPTCGPAGGITGPWIVRDRDGSRPRIVHETGTGRLAWEVYLDIDAWKITVTRRAGRVFAERLRAAATDEAREVILAELDAFRGDVVVVGEVDCAGQDIRFRFDASMHADHARVTLDAWRCIEPAWTPEAARSWLASASDVPEALLCELAKIAADEEAAEAIDNADDRLGYIFEGHAFVRDGVASLSLFSGGVVRLPAPDVLRIMREAPEAQSAITALRAMHEKAAQAEVATYA